jgi:hypothetical protein
LCANSLNDDDKTGATLVADDALVNDGCPAVGAAESGANCSNSTDNDGDSYVNDGCPQAGVFSEAQFKIGTNSLNRCGAGDEGTGVPSSAWPSDLYSGGTPSSTDKINILDLSSFLAPAAVRRIGTSPGNGPFSSRWDLQPGHGVFNQFINATDIVARRKPGGSTKRSTCWASGGTARLYQLAATRAEGTKEIRNGGQRKLSAPDDHRVPSCSPLPEHGRSPSLRYHRHPGGEQCEGSSGVGEYDGRQC